MEELDYKDIVKDEKGLKKYLDQLIERTDIDIRNKIYSACLAGRFFEIDKMAKKGAVEFIKEMQKES